MSLETLLEAAKYVELSNVSHTKKARGGKPVTLRVIRKPEHDAQAFHPYAKAAPAQENKTDAQGDSSPDKEGDDGQKRRYGGAGTREVHNKLEKNRRAHLKECFDALKSEVPNMEDKKTSNLSILRGALRHIQMLKRQEREYEQTLQTLAHEKIKSQERIVELKRELAQQNIEYDLEQFLKDEETDSDSTATAEGGSPIVSEDEDDGVTVNIKLENGAHKETVKASQAAALPVIKLNKEKPQLIAPAVPKSVVVTGNTDKKSQSTTSGFIRIIHPEAAAAAVAAAAKPSTKKPTVAASLAASALAMQQWVAESKGEIKTLPSSILSDAQTIIVTTVAAVTTTTTTTTSAATTITRTPVAQILHQAITQRAAQQQQQQQETQNKVKQDFVVTAAPGLMNATITTLKPITSLGQIQQTIPLNRFITPGTSFMAPVSMLAGSTPGATLTNLSKFVAATATTSSDSTVNAKTENLTPGQLKQNTINIPNLATMKQIFATPITQIITPTAAQLGQLMSQAIVRPTLTQVMTSASSASSSVAQIATPGILTQAGGVPSVINSLGQLTPVTQLLSPVTVVSPAIQVQNLGQTQLGALTNSSVIKPLTQIPIIQPINLQQVQQQVLKPVVMVPGVLSPANLPTTSSSAVHVALTNTLPVSNSS